MQYTWAEGPQKKTQIILSRALEVINSLPYIPSIRFVYYRLWQEGLFKDAKNKAQGYRNFIKHTSIARQAFYKGWKPDTFIDDTREILVRAGGKGSIEDCVKGIPSALENSVRFMTDHFFKQENYIEIWFEARAMISQFEYYTHDISLVPFGGCPSVPHKWNTAKHLDDMKERYKKPIIILYFGDCDKGGETVYDTAMREIGEYADTTFDVIWCGLTLEQVRKHKLPDNPEKPGQYQWEALPDKEAKKIIQANFYKYVDRDIISQNYKKAKELQEIWRKRLEPIIKQVRKEFEKYDDSLES